MEAPIHAARNFSQPRIFPNGERPLSVCFFIILTASGFERWLAVFMVDGRKGIV
jgi:hypothetical protein